MKVLIFGGTGEARKLADRLVDAGHDVTTSLAGRTLEPLLPEGSVRIGGFGDYPRLRAYLSEEGLEAVVDATHPFAETMSFNIAAACGELDLPLIRLCRLPWDRPEGAHWIEIDTIEDAGKHIPDDAVLMVTTGQGAIGEMRLPPRCRRLVRLIEPPDPDKRLSGNDTIIVDRPPYTLEGEKALMAEYGVTHLLAKNSGGEQTRAKLDAAAELGVTILVVRRPQLPPVAREVATVEDAVAALHELAP